MTTILRDGQTMVFIGDSITDCGRRGPENTPLGFGYVRLFHDMMIAREPEKNLRIINRGIGGNKVVDLRDRWHDDALSHRPDWLSVKIGINDINWHLLRKAEGVDFLPPEEFHEIYRSLLAATREALPETGILLISPFYLSDNRTPGSHRAKIVELLPQYINAVYELHREFETRYLPLHDIFKEHLRLRHADCFCPEPVHPNHTGHFVMAESVYRAMAGGE